MSAKEYWGERYTLKEGIQHHSSQNLRIATDFIHHARQRKPFADALSSESIIEIGCGTGELAAMIKSIYGTGVMYATDFSREAVMTAEKRHWKVNFWVFDILTDPPFRTFDLLVSSNTLEHFADAHGVIRRMFMLSPMLMLIVPFEQPVTDVYECEGGAGHAAKLDLEFFSFYTVIDYFLFETHGWQHSSLGEKPQQLAILITK